jgi:uncharacterized protein HemY
MTENKLRERHATTSMNEALMHLMNGDTEQAEQKADEARIVLHAVNNWKEAKRLQQSFDGME